MLTGDRAKYLGIVAGVTFAALLIAQQASIACGLLLRTTVARSRTSPTWTSGSWTPTSSSSTSSSR